MPRTTNETALEKYQSMIKTIDKKKMVNATDILSLSWQEYAELITMHHLPQVDHVHVEALSPFSPIYWMMKDLSMKQTIALWLTCSAALIGSSIHSPLSAAVGFMTWVPIEYGYHRFIGHMPVVNELTKHANFYAHGKHHFAPKDLDHVLLPPFVVFVAAAALYLYVFKNLTQNPEIAVAFAILHYLLYDIMHYALHKFSIKEASEIPIVGKYLVSTWANHARHHIEPETNYLITTGGISKFIYSFFDTSINNQPSQKVGENLRLSQ